MVLRKRVQLVTYLKKNTEANQRKGALNIPSLSMELSLNSVWSIVTQQLCHRQDPSQKLTKQMELQRCI